MRASRRLSEIVHPENQLEHQCGQGDLPWAQFGPWYMADRLLHIGVKWSLYQSLAEQVAWKSLESKMNFEFGFTGLFLGR